MRRALIVGSVVIVIIGIGIAIYFLFFATSASLGIIPAGGTSLPSAGETGTNEASSTGQQATGPVSSSATQVASGLVEIDSGPVVAGDVAFDITSTSTGTLEHDVEIEYLNRQSGNIFSYLFNEKSLTLTSNHTIPGIEEADWLQDGATAFVQYLSGDDNSTVNTYALAANGSGGSFLPQDIADLSVGPTSILYVASGDNGSIATVEKPSGSGAAQAFTTPLSSITAEFAGKDYLVYTKPSASVPGYAFLVSGGVFTQVAGPLDGLVALASPNGTYALVSYSVSGVMNMELVNLKTDADIPLPVATIADKCVWSADSTSIYCGIPTNPPATYAYPDDWYQGAVHFSDNIWKIDVTNRVAELVLNFSSATNLSLDATSLAVDPNQTVLVFRNKNDGSLWAYQL